MVFLLFFGLFDFFIFCCFAFVGFGVIRSFGFRAVIAPQIIVIQRLEILAYRNDGNCGVESKARICSAGTLIPDDFASSGRRARI